MRYRPATYQFCRMADTPRDSKDMDRNPLSTRVAPADTTYDDQSPLPDLRSRTSKLRGRRSGLDRIQNTEKKTNTYTKSYK